MLLVLRFVTELALLAALAVVGWSIGPQLATSLLLALAGPLLVALVWGRLVAPRASYRLTEPWRLLLEVVLFLGAAAGLVAVGHPVAALVLASTSVASALLIRRFAPGS